MSKRRNTNYMLRVAGKHAFIKSIGASNNGRNKRMHEFKNASSGSDLTANAHELTKTLSFSSFHT